MSSEPGPVSGARPGRPTPLGATWDGEGTNFAVFSRHADAVDVCLFDDSGRESRTALTETTHHVWHGHLPRVGPGQRYGFRVSGPFDPGAGLRLNPAKLLIDPYARAIDGALTLDDALFGSAPGRDDVAQPDDSSPYVPKSVVVHDAFPWGDDRRPRRTWPDTVIYELHVKSFTADNPEIPPALRGTYAGLGHPAATSYLKGLGVTAVELLPVHHFVSEPHLLRSGLTNHWGYNSLGFFAPHADYSASGSRGEQVGEFKAMVRSLHAAGLEVVLDVVYNHTAEGDHTGPTLSLRGMDPSYYRLEEHDPSRYRDYTGCGNTVDMRRPHALQLMMDSLRYWVTEMHVDGFRFDLASALARSPHDVDRLSAFFAVIHQDPVINSVKLIAEPWDVGQGGYQVGGFPPPWTEWNGRYRDTVRDVWSGQSLPPQGMHDFAYRLSGSSDLYQDDGRRPYASVNFVTAHDGFTLRDLVTYERKRNDANGEGSRDGEDHNRSWNCGVEGETDDPAVNSLRRRQSRNLLTTLLLSTGVPMLSMGDEVRRTQLGNNNAYCRPGDDHAGLLTAMPWAALDDPDGAALHEWVRRLLALRAAHPVFRKATFFSGLAGTAAGVKDLGWFAPTGEEMSDARWFDRSVRSLGMYLNGDTTGDACARSVVDDSFLLLLHTGPDDLAFCLPASPWATSYDVVLDTTDEHLDPACSTGPVAAGTELLMTARSVVLLRAHR